MRKVTMLAAAALAATAGCGRTPAAVAPASPAARADPDFRSPPTVSSATRDATGAVTLGGTAPAGAQVVLRAPDGQTASATAGTDGAWRLSLPGAPAPRAFALSAAAGGRLVRGEGALLVAPPPFVAATLMRGGAAALPIGPVGPGFRWTSVDTDPGGGAAVSGFAAPGAALRLAIDGVTRGVGSADAAGRFGVLWLGGPAPPGAHVVTVTTAAGVRSSSIPFGPVTLGAAPVRIASEATGWRIDWVPPGGGVQTLHLLAPDVGADAQP